jgi:hypothetical protein
LDCRVGDVLDHLPQDRACQNYSPHSWGLVFGLRKLRDVIAGILERDELAPARQRYWIVKPTLATAIANDASPSCRIRF